MNSVLFLVYAGTVMQELTVSLYWKKVPGLSPPASRGLSIIPL